MRCIFCNKKIIPKNNDLGLPITLPTRGVAHSFCAERDLIERRVFASIHLADLAQADLYELRELVLTEINAREGNANDEIDLF